MHRERTSEMERIAKWALSVLCSIFAVFAILFGVCWRFDGFAAAWGVFIGSDSLSAILSFVGVYDWLIGIILALAIAGIAEALIGRRIKKRTAGLIVDIAAAIVSFIGFIALF